MPSPRMSTRATAPEAALTEAEAAELNLLQVLARLGLGVGASMWPGQKTITDGTEVVFEGTAGDTWAWLRRTGRIHGGDR